jgi:RNA polymerase sigma-54 factor
LRSNSVLRRSWEINPALEEGSESDEEEKEDIAEDDDGLFDEETDNDADDNVTSDDDDDKSSKEDSYDIDDYLDEDEAYSYKEQTNNSGPDDERKEVPLSQGPGFQEQLLSQLGLQPLDDHHYQVGAYLIGNIDEDGYMRRELAAIIDDIAFSLNIATTEENCRRCLQ